MVTTRPPKKTREFVVAMANVVGLGFNLVVIADKDIVTGKIVKQKKNRRDKRQ